MTRWFDPTLQNLVIGNANTAFDGSETTLISQGGAVREVAVGSLISLSTVTEANITLADNTTDDVSITKHGFAPKAPNDATKFLNGVGAYGNAGTLTAGTACTQNPFAGGTKTTQAHGLGATPAFVTSYIECLTAELGYSIGDRLSTGVYTTSTAGTFGWVVESDATNVNILTGTNPPAVPRKDTLVVTTLTAGNWKVVAIPYKVN